MKLCHCPEYVVIEELFKSIFSLFGFTLALIGVIVNLVKKSTWNTKVGMYSKAYLEGDLSTLKFESTSFLEFSKKQWGCAQLG